MIICNSPDELIKKTYDYVRINKVKIISGAKDPNRCSFGFKVSNGQTFIVRPFTMEYNMNDRSLFDKIVKLNIKLYVFINKQLLPFI